MSGNPLRIQRERSTVDSLLLLASSAVVRDVVQKVFRPDLSDRRLSLYGKLTTAVIGIGALAVALQQPEGQVFWFVLFAWAGLASAFAPVVLCALFWSGTTRAGAIAGMIGGFLTAILFQQYLQTEFYELYEMIPGFAAGFLLTIGVSLCTEAPPGAAADHDAVWKKVGHPFRKREGREGIEE